MAKIVCPHCNAVNQDVSLNDPCWQCGTILSAPPTSIETGEGAPTSEANPANATGSSSARIQRQIDIEKEREANPPPPVVLQKPKPMGGVVVWVSLLVLALIVFFVLYIMWHH